MLMEYIGNYYKKYSSTLGVKFKSWNILIYGDKCLSTLFFESKGDFQREIELWIQ